MIRALDGLKNPIELRRLQLGSLGEAQVQRPQKFTQGFLLCKRWGVVNAENKRLAARFQCFSGGNVRLNHELFDELVRIEPFGNDDLVDLAVGREQDFLFRQIEFQRFARVTPPLQHGIGVPQRFQYAVENRRSLVIRRTVDRGLRLRIGQLRRRFHHDAVKFVRFLASVGRKNHTDRKGRAVFQFTKRTEIV